jgi:D-alanine-D-alanine ligase
MRFVIVYDADEIEHKINYQRINSYHTDVYHAIQGALEDNGHQVRLVCADDNLRENLDAIHPDFAFNCASYTRCHEERAYAPRILREMKIPFTGSGGQTCSDAYDKARTKQILQETNIRTPRAVVLYKPFKIPIYPLRYPLFVKPVKGGCSYGINCDSLVNDPQSLRTRLSQLAQECEDALLLEEYLPGREFTVGLLGNQVVQILPIMEYQHDQNGLPPFRSYRLKMVQWEEEEARCPAELKIEKRNEIENMARKSFRALGCRDYARIDFRQDNEGKPYVLEVNALPNLMQNPALMPSWQEGRIGFQ